jgi:hypothetical protein
VFFCDKCPSSDNGIRLQEVSISSCFVVVCVNGFMCGRWGSVLNGTVNVQTNVYNDQVCIVTIITEPWGYVAVLGE